MQGGEDLRFGERFVWVRRQWNDYRVAKYPLESVGGIHWSDFSGGVQQRAPRYFLHGHVSCTGWAAWPVPAHDKGLYHQEGQLCSNLRRTGSHCRLSAGEGTLAPLPIFAEGRQTV